MFILTHNLLKHCCFPLRFYISILDAALGLCETVYLYRTAVARHQWRALPMQSWMDNSGSCTVLGSCLWKECHAAGITDRSCSHGGLLFWWDGSSMLTKARMFWWARGHQVHTTRNVQDTEHGDIFQCWWIQRDLLSIWPFMNLWGFACVIRTWQRSKCLVQVMKTGAFISTMALM